MTFQIYICGSQINLKHVKDSTDLCVIFALLQAKVKALIFQFELMYVALLETSAALLYRTVTGHQREQPNVEEKPTPLTADELLLLMR